MNSRLASISKEVSYALRHAPWEYELELDSEGFVSIEQLLSALNESCREGKSVSFADLQQIIAESDKQRHEIVGDKIRALYGHSVPGKIELTPDVPPSVLYHGTTRTAARLVISEGLKPMGRQYVHLSSDVETARAVGTRRDTHPAVLCIAAKVASDEGVAFYRGNDRVWLADFIPKKYITSK